MKTFRYITTKTPYFGLTEKELNEFGAGGWELICVVISPSDDRKEYFFKKLHGN